MRCFFSPKVTVIHHDPMLLFSNNHGSGNFASFLETKLTHSSSRTHLPSLWEESVTKTIGIQQTNISFSQPALFEPMISIIFQTSLWVGYFFLFPGYYLQGTIECTPNSVPMVFIVFFRDSWGFIPHIYPRNIGLI